MRKIWDKIRKFWDKIVRLILKVPYDKLLHFIAGLIVASFFAIVFDFKAPILAAALAGLIKEAFDKYTTKQVDWYDFVYTCAGGAVIQVFALLG